MNNLIDNLNISQKIAILKSRKDFCLYNINEYNKVQIKLTNDLNRYLYKDGFKHFKLVDLVKSELEKNELLTLFATFN